MGYDFKLNPNLIRVLYRRLIIAGYSNVEAGNLIARIMGLGTSEKGWTVKELQHLLFVEDQDKKNKGT